MVEPNTNSAQSKLAVPAANPAASTKVKQMIAYSDSLLMTVEVCGVSSYQLTVSDANHAFPDTKVNSANPCATVQGRAIMVISNMVGGGGAGYTYRTVNTQ
jgi:hypothetical protein